MIYATLEQWTSGWKARILNPGVKPFYFKVAHPDMFYTKGAIVREINKVYPGITYVSKGLFSRMVGAQP